MSHNNLPNEIAQIKKKPLTYLFEFCNQTYNNLFPRFETTISHKRCEIIRETQKTLKYRILETNIDFPVNLSSPF